MAKTYKSVDDMVRDTASPEFTEYFEEYQQWHSRLSTLRSDCERYVAYVFGDRCEHFDDICHCCKAWAAFDRLFQFWDDIEISPQHSEISCNSPPDSPR